MVSTYGRLLRVGRFCCINPTQIFIWRYLKAKSWKGI